MTKQLFYILIGLTLFVGIVLLLYFIRSNSPERGLTDNLSDRESLYQPEVKNDETVLLAMDFKTRITKKPFGIFIAPQNSPVQPERFSGYHTGIDIEYGDVDEDVLIFAVADGIVEYSGWVSGYGGVMAIRHSIDGKTYLAIYGHLNPGNLPTKGEGVLKSELIAVLGQGHTSQTDNERKHLHFSLYLGDDLNLKGYVNSREELSNWIDPLIILD